MQNFKTYWPIGFSVVTVAVTLIIQYSAFGYRLTAAEDRLDRQGVAISEIRAQQTTLATNFARLEGVVSAMSDNVSYIRSRIDNVIK